MSRVLQFLEECGLFPEERQFFSSFLQFLEEYHFFFNFLKNNISLKFFVVIRISLMFL